MIGGTAWDFANANRVPPGSLDLLVIDEAGQFCLANTIAVAPAAANLLLLGDPQQLPQVSQGTHPEPVDGSALGWLVDGQRTLPDERGYFLDRSYRMHPAVCARGVGAVLRGPAAVAHRAHRRASPRRVSARVHVLAVRHEGNSTESPRGSRGDRRRDPAAARRGVDRRARHPAADGLRRAGAGALQRPGGAAAPACWPTAGLGDVRVGTVDKFQGAEAPVAFISMTASSVDEVPRGISFLLNRNRLNVAISRAQYAAVIVRAEALTDYLPAAPAGLVELGRVPGADGSRGRMADCGYLSDECRPPPGCVVGIGRRRRLAGRRPVMAVAASRRGRSTPAA